MEFKGYSYGYDGRRGMYRDPRSMESIGAMRELGCNWAVLAFSMKQESFSSTEIKFSYKRSVTDSDIQAAVRNIHERGMKVCLKPMVDCMDGVWRANISFPEKEFGDYSYWDLWFDSYTDFLCHYAEIARDTGCEMLCVGCEMLGTEKQEKRWRELLGKIRDIYSGPLVYNTNHGKEDGVSWWDAVDYIGTSAYFPTADKPGASLSQMKDAWEKQKPALKAVSQKWGKKVIFIETGCRSARGCAMMPWDFTHRDLPYDEEEQANFFESALAVYSGEPWFAGFFWWEWNTFLYPKEQGRTDRSFAIHGKKAEQVLKRWYTDILKED